MIKTFLFALLISLCADISFGSISTSFEGGVPSGWKVSSQWKTSSFHGTKYLCTNISSSKKDVSGLVTLTSSVSEGELPFCDNVVADVELSNSSPVDVALIDKIQVVVSTNNWREVIPVGEPFEYYDASSAEEWVTHRVVAPISGLSNCKEFYIGLKVIAAGYSSNSIFVKSFSVDFLSGATCNDLRFISNIVPQFGDKNVYIAAEVKKEPADRISDLTVWAEVRRNNLVYTNQMILAENNTYTNDVLQVDSENVGVGIIPPIDAGDTIIVGVFTKYISSMEAIGELDEGDGHYVEKSSKTISYGAPKLGSVWINEFSLDQVELCGTVNRDYVHGWRIELVDLDLKVVCFKEFDDSFDFLENMPNKVIGLLTYSLGWHLDSLNNRYSLRLINAAGIIEHEIKDLIFTNSGDSYGKIGIAPWSDLGLEFDWSGTATNESVFGWTKMSPSFGKLNYGQYFEIENMGWFKAQTTYITETGLVRGFEYANVNYEVNFSGGKINGCKQTDGEGWTPITEFTGTHTNEEFVTAAFNVSAFGWFADSLQFPLSFGRTNDNINISLSPSVAEDDFTTGALNAYWLNNGTKKFNYYKLDTDGYARFDARIATRGMHYAEIDCQNPIKTGGKGYATLSLSVRNTDDFSSGVSNSDYAYVLIATNNIFSDESVIACTKGLSNKVAGVAVNALNFGKSIVRLPLFIDETMPLYVRVRGESGGMSSSYLDIKNIRIAFQDLVDATGLRQTGTKENPGFEVDIEPLCADGQSVSNVSVQLMMDVNGKVFANYATSAAVITNNLSASKTFTVSTEVISAGLKAAIGYPLLRANDSVRYWAEVKYYADSRDPDPEKEWETCYFPDNRINESEGLWTVKGEYGVDWNAVSRDCSYSIEGDPITYNEDLTFTQDSPSTVRFSVRVFDAAGVSNVTVRLSTDGIDDDRILFGTNATGSVCYDYEVLATGLVANAEYTVAVTAENVNGEAVTASPMTFKFVTLPEKPTAEIEAVSMSMVKLTAYGDAAGYVVDGRLSPGWTQSEEKMDEWVKGGLNPNSRFSEIVYLFATNRVGAASATNQFAAVCYTCAAAATRAPEVVKDVVTVEVGAANDMPEDGNPVGTEYAVLVKTNGVDSAYVAVDGAVVWKTLDAWKTDEKVTVEVPTLNMTATNSFSFVTRNFDLLETRTDLSEATTNCTFDMTAEITADPVQKASPFGTVDVALKFFDPAISANAQGEVEYSIDNGPWMSAGSFDVQFNDLESTAKFAWDAWSAVGKAEGAYQYRLRAKVSAGARSSECSNVVEGELDFVRPTVELESETPDPFNADKSPMRVTVRFSEAVTGFEAGKVSVENGTVERVIKVSSAAGMEYEVEIEPNGDGTVRVKVEAGKVTDAMGNGNAASAALTRTYDTKAPTGLTISGDPGEGVVTNGTAFAFEASAGDAACYHWMTNGVAVGDNSSAKLGGTAVEGTNTVSVSAEDAAGNVSSPAVRKWVVDTVEPKNLGIVGKPAALTNKPEFTLTARAEDQTRVSYHWTFNGATFEGEKLSNTAKEGENSVSVYATDEAENKTEPVEYAWTLDTKAPTVELSSSTPDPFNGNDTFEVTVTFSEAVTGFNEGCVTVSNGVVGAWEKASGVANAYTVTIVGSTDGEIKVYIEAGKVFDLAGNANTASGILTRTCDTSRPRVKTLESETPAAFNAAKAPMVVTVTFSEPVTNFTASSVAVDNGKVSEVTGMGTVYSFKVTPDAEGAVTVKIPQDKVVDAAGNGNEASEVLVRTYDTTPPAAPTISGTPANGARTNVEAVELTAASEGETSCVYHWDFNGTKSDGATLKGTAREDVNIVRVKAEDAAGNVSAESGWSWTLDTVKPKVTEFTSQTPERFNAVTPFVVKVTFSEQVTNFTDKAVVTNNVKSVVVDGSGTEYTMTVTPDKDGEVSVQIAAAKVFDLAGNGNEASEALTRTYDNTKPSVTLSSDASQSFNTSPLVVTVTFSEPVTNFTTSTISVQNGTVSGYSGSEAFYTVNIVPASEGCVTAWVKADKVFDLAGNGNAASAELTRMYDTSRPTVVLSSESADRFNKDALPLVVTATFSEPVTNFTASSVAVDNGKVSEVTGMGTVYSFKVTPDAEGAVAVKIPQDKVADAAGNGNEASEALVRTYDTTPPTVTLSSETSGRFKESPLVVTATFSEAVTNFTIGAVTVNNGKATNVEEITGVAHAYRVTIEPRAGDVAVQIEAGAVKDLAGNGNEDSNELTCIFDNTPPTVTLSSDAPEYFNSKPLKVMVTFSEEVRGFAADKLAVSNGTVNAVSAAKDVANAYEIEIEPPDQDGEVSVSVAAGAVTDLAGNENEASEVLKRTYDGTPPTATLTSETRNPFNSRDVFAVTAEFSELVTNFTADAVTVSNDGQVTNVTVGTAREVELSPGTVTNVYTLLIKPLKDGEITVKIAEDAVTDLAGNGNVESNELEYECRIKKPTVKLESTTAEHFGLGEPFNVTATFSTAVTNFTEMSISVSNGTVKTGSVKAAESGDAYDFEIEPSQDGTVVVLIAADVVADAAGNGNEASAALQRVYDTEAPKNLVITGTPSNGEKTSRKTFSFAVAADEANVINAFQWKINKGTQITVSGVGKNTLTSDGRESLIVEGENTVIVRVRDSAMHWSEWTDGYTWIYDPSAGGGNVEFGGGVCVKVDAETGRTNEIRFTGLDLKPGAAGELTLDGFSASIQVLTDFQMWLVVRDELEGESRRVKAGETATFDTTKGELKVEVPAAATEGAKSLFILGVDNHE